MFVIFVKSLGMPLSPLEDVTRDSYPSIWLGHLSPLTSSLVASIPSPSREMLSILLRELVTLDLSPQFHPWESATCKT